MSLKMLTCPICKSDLEEPRLMFKTCMRSDGLRISEPLKKIICQGCNTIIGANSQVEKIYHRSTGESVYEKKRHALVASGLSVLIKKIDPKPNKKLILEVGAANFFTSHLLKNENPNFEILALEPAPEAIPDFNNIEIVIEDFFKFSPSIEFDICFSNQVIEHFDNPINFLEKSKSLVRDGGLIIVACPTTTTPHQELLFSDHLFHFSEKSMTICAQSADLNLISCNVSSWDDCTHVYVFRNEPFSQHNKKISDKFISTATEFYDDWIQEDRRLLGLIDDNKQLVMFGAGEYAQLIRTYLPNTYSLTSHIVVDDLQGIRSFDKLISLTPESFEFDAQLLLGVSPKSQHKVIENLHTRMKLEPSQIIVPFG